MRQFGVKKVTFSDDMALPVFDTPGDKSIGIVSIELFDTAPPVIAFEPDEPAPEEKPPGICVHPGCGEKNGWQFAREFCRDHGLAAAGVTRAR